MLPRRLTDVRALLSTAEFQAWWAELLRARLDFEAAQERVDELLSQATLTEFRAELTHKNALETLHRAGECEDAAAAMIAETAELQKRSGLTLAEFEEQRFRTSESWYRLGAAERVHDEALQPADVRAEYEREEQKKAELWASVDKQWERTAELSLLIAEHRARGRKIRREAEAQFALTDERKKRAKELRDEAQEAAAAKAAMQARIDQLLSDARRRFGCASGTDFLYFRQNENPKLAFCVSLVEDRNSYNVEVKALAIYSVEQRRGIAFLEPARAEFPSPEEGDRRFEEYFLKGRRGRESSQGA